MLRCINGAEVGCALLNNVAVGYASLRHCNISILFGFLLQDAGCRGVFYSGSQKLCRQERGGKLDFFNDLKKKKKNCFVQEALECFFSLCVDAGATRRQTWGRGRVWGA